MELITDPGFSAQGSEALGASACGGAAGTAGAGGRWARDRCSLGFLSVCSSATSFVAAGISKQDIRERIWDYMESENLADFPRPVHHRIPNFKVRQHSWSGHKESLVSSAGPSGDAVTVLLHGGFELGGQRAV